MMGVGSLESSDIEVITANRDRYIKVSLINQYAADFIIANILSLSTKAGFS